ncbi:MAG: YkgJ family cysteine cluster protein [Desulfosalsimonas sp.]|uniref:YkgJ family cysteine cluster protein n=1 Tax=Desulfosalsimonas sp. TaxID=3073848 RepID=UPI00397081EF
METEENAGIPPVKLNANSRFHFRCHPEISCFTKCCRGINIMLTPYDIVRLKNRLELSSDDFLAIYTTPQLLEKTDLPVVTLRMLDDQPGEPVCPFVREDQGCIVYEDRPTTCRYYPLGVASLSHKDEADEGFYFFINEPHCRGFEEDVEWTVDQWRSDQGVDVYDRINAPWTELIVRKRSIPANIRLTQKTKNMFFTASYDIDRFRRFVFESSFLSVYEVDPATVEKIRSDELELLNFSFRWLKWVLFQEGEEFAINQQAAEARGKRS